MGVSSKKKKKKIQQRMIKPVVLIKLVFWFQVNFSITILTPNRVASQVVITDSSVCPPERYRYYWEGLL